MSRYLLVLTTVLSCTLTSAALGQTRPSTKQDKWEFSVFAGASYRGDDVFPTPIEGVGARNVGLNFAPGYLVGARITENRGNRMAAELDYSLANQPVRFQNLTPFITGLNLDTRVHNVVYTVVFYGTDRKSRLRPYGAVGAGVALFELFGDLEEDAAAQGLDLKDRWKIGASIGGGVKYRVTDRTGFRFDVRDFVTGVPDFGLKSSGTLQSPAFRPDGVLNNWQVNVGFFYSFKGF